MEKKLTEFQNKSQSGEDSLIIQCPSCQTKFAVPPTSLPQDKNTKKDPRFHCSRCDGIFSHSLEGSETGNVSTQPLETEGSEHEARFSSKATQIDFSEDAVQMELPLGSRLKNINRPPAYEDSRREADMLAETQELIFSDLPDKTEKRKKNNPFSKEALLKEIASRQEKIADPNEMEPGSWRGFRRILAPSIFSLLLIVFFSFSLSANISPSIALVDKLMATQSHLPPPELFLTNLNYSRVSLLDGRQVPLVTGTLVNRTSQGITEVVLEGLAFGDTGQFVSSQKINAASAGSTVEELENVASLDALRAVQSKEPRRNWSIKSGEQKDFAVAITEIDAEKTRYYSARVYSVR